jgi:hypothetical protein
MKKVIKPSKQPTKKRSQRSPRTAKLTIAISKIAAQLVKDHPKLIKGGGSLGITELLFSKILIKGGELNNAARGKIITFLNDIAPQVNKLKQELITKLLKYLATQDVITDYNIFVNIIDINREFMKGLYDYDIKDEDQKNLGNFREEIKEYIAILDIVRKFYILSRLKDDETEAHVSIMKQINKNEFEQLPPDILEALQKKTENLKAILEEYLKNKKRDNGNGAPEVKEEDNEETLDALRTTLEKIKKDMDEYHALFSSNNIEYNRGEDKYIFKESNIQIQTNDQINALKDLNLLYSEFIANVYDEYLNISSRYTEGNKYKKEDIKVDLDSLLKLNEFFNDHYISQKDRISGYLDIIDPDRNVFPERKEINDFGWGEGPHVGPNVKSLIAKYNGKGTGGNPAKYKSTGQVVYIMYKNKKYKRVIYVKDKRNTRYCKINKEYILLSKLKVIQ